MQIGYKKVSQHIATTPGQFSAIFALLTSLFILCQKKNGNEINSGNQIFKTQELKRLGAQQMVGRHTTYGKHCCGCKLVIDDR